MGVLLKRPVSQMPCAVSFAVGSSAVAPWVTAYAATNSSSDRQATIGASASDRSEGLASAVRNASTQAGEGVADRVDAAGRSVGVQAATATTTTETASRAKAPARGFRCTV